MDHLPFASGSVLPSIPVPFVVVSAPETPYGYSADDFIEFPANHLRELKFLHPEITPQNALLSLIQSWLFFGTLAEFFRQSIRVNAFTRADQDGNLVICTSALHGLRSQWITSLPSRSPFTIASRQGVGRRCGVVLARATWALEQFQRVLADEPRSHLVLFSIKVMLCSLCQTVRTVLYPTQTLDAVLDRLHFRPAVAAGGVGSDFILWGYMVSNGWCPHQINHLTTLHKATVMIYLASIRRRTQNSSHSDCLQKGRCMDNQIESATYYPSHVTPGCVCEDVSVDEEEIMKKLEDNQIPLLSCTKNASGDFSIDVISADIDTVFGTPTLYYAISHVWADGLGNTGANSLPKCQFKRLFKKLKLLSRTVAETRPFPAFSRSKETDNIGSVVFWMDVFCIPVNKQGNERNVDLKRRAIALMDLIYSCAYQVLVMDAEMEMFGTQDNLGNDSSELLRLKASTETLSRIATCKWMTRSWTLQEGALASTLWVHYARATMRHKAFYTLDYSPGMVDDVPPETFSVVKALEKHTVLPSVGRGSQDLADAAPYCSSPREVQFLEVWNSLIGRSTTQPDDIHYIVANLLDFSVQQLPKSGGDERTYQQKRHDSYQRMRAIILAQKRLPMQLLCLPREKNGFKHKDMIWLPETPVGPRLTDDAFACSVRVVKGGFTMEPPCITSCFLAWPSHGASTSFCLDISSINGAHPHVTLDLDDATSLVDSDLLVYLNVSKEAHTLLTDSNKSGAAFRVSDRQNTSIEATYFCSLKFSHCWEAHCVRDYPDFVPAAAVRKGMSIRITGPETSTVLNFRRPARVGANLIATFPARFIVTITVLSSAGGLFLTSIIMLPLTGNFFFNLSVGVYSRLLFYACFIPTALSYVTVLLFIGARYISAPWIRKSYLTEKLPWYVRMIYSERLPSLLRLSMKFRRLQLAPVAYLLGSRRPYDVQVDDRGIKSTIWSRRLRHMAMSPWQQGEQMMKPLQEYRDDYVDDSTPVPSGALDSSLRDSYLSSLSDNTLVGDLFNFLGEEKANAMRTIIRALVATRTDETGDNIWDIMCDAMVASRWINRTQKRRRIRDFLFDYGIVRGRR